MSQEKTTFPAVSFDEFAPTSYEAWKAEAVASLKGGEFDKKLLTKTYEGVTLRPLYTQADVDALNAPDTFPGYRDYLRNAHIGGYLSAPWTIAQSVGTATPERANALLKEEISRGANGVNVTLGEQGVPVASAAEMKALLTGIDLATHPLQMNCGASALEALGWLAEAKTCFGGASGCVGADPLGALACTGGLSRTLDELYNDMAESVKLAAEKAPGLRTVLIDGNVYANGGANAVQEVACVLAVASAYLTALTERGVDIDAAAGAIRVSLSLGANFFMEISKLRAARVVYAQMVAAFGGNEEARKIDVFARTSDFTKTVYDPYVNLLRATTEAFSGAMGGVDAMEVAPLDAAYGSSDDQTRRIARNIQIMLQEEFNLLEPIDPAGGSWYVETLTAELAKSIWAEFQKIEAAGGMAAALKVGSVQADIAKVLDKRFQKLATRADRAVGTNMYANMTEKPLDRPARAVSKAVAGAAESVTAIVPRRWTEQFESLRAATEAYESKTGKTVKVFLANMGPIPQHKARADFATGFFEVGHFEVVTNDGFATVEEAADAAAKSGAAVAVICSTDATYPELVSPLAQAIKAAAPGMTVMLAGAPAPEHKDAYVAAGVSNFIHVRANCYDILKSIQIERGIC